MTVQKFYNANVIILSVAHVRLSTSVQVFMNCTIILTQCLWKC